MHNTEEFKPVFSPNYFVDEGGQILTPRYYVGEPVDYRLSLAGTDGCLLHNGMKITNSGEAFEVSPIAVRILEGELFGKGHRNWGEIFFVNRKNQVGQFMFHGYSLDNFRKAFTSLWYNKIAACEANLKVTLIAKTNRDNQRYWMAFFQFVSVSQEDINIRRGLIANVKKQGLIYRYSTVRPAYKTLYCENYGDLTNGKQLDKQAVQIEPAY